MNNSQFFEFFTEEQLNLIHERSLDILENIGINVNNKEAVEIFKEKGCIVTNENHVTIPRDIVNKTLKDTPNYFTWYGRIPEDDVTIPQDGPIFSICGEAVNVCDLETREFRPATPKDLGDIAHLHQVCKGYDVLSTAVVVDDPAGIVCTKLYPSLMNTTKNIRFGPNTVKNAIDAYKMCTMVAGGEEEFKKRPFVTFVSCPMISPLTLDDQSTGILIYIVKKGLPFSWPFCPNAGITSPLSLLGTVIQGNAEFLAVNALCQLITPGTNIHYNVLPTVADLRSGAYATGGIEQGMLIAAFSQMSRYYDIPSTSITGMTNAKEIDVQAGYEVVQTALTAIMGGCDMLEFGGHIDALMTFDYVHFMICSELVTYFKYLKAGFEDISTADACVEALKEVGCGGDFLTSSHTVENIRKVYFESPMSDRSSRSAWEMNGRPNAVKTAQEIGMKAMALPREVMLPLDVVEKLEEEFPALKTIQI